jgi:membrane-bound lytic murein transglycosylase MltF
MKQGVADDRMRSYMSKVKELKDPTARAEYQRFTQTLALFKKYGNQYGFDPLMLAAQGYQESQLNQNAKSHVGAVGVMQLMPATGAQMTVGDIHLTEANIHAGTKYMDQLMTTYFGDVQSAKAMVHCSRLRPITAARATSTRPAKKLRKEA